MAAPLRPTWWAGVLPTAVLPVVVGLVTIAGTSIVAWHGWSLRPLDPFGVVLLLGGPAALVVRRWHPAGVYAAIATLLVAYFGAGYPVGPAPLAALVALAAAINAGHRLGAYVITGITFPVLVLVQVLQDPTAGVPFGRASGWLAWLAVIITAAELWRARRERRDQAKAVAAEAERRRGSEERLRIARDLHDALGHHVSLINVQAGVALYLMDDDPQQARDALTAIKQSSRELLREMRSTLGVLRGVDEEPPQQPVAGLARMDDLIAATRAAGLPVTVTITGEPRELPPSVDAAAYRIMQEALTNARKHAGPATAVVLLTYTEDGLLMRIDDDGTDPGGPADGSATSSGLSGGNGLPGMRERAAALGGTLTAGPRSGGGFRVDAHLPVDEEAR